MKYFTILLVVTCVIVAVQGKQVPLLGGLDKVVEGVADAAGKAMDSAGKVVNTVVKTAVDASGKAIDAAKDAAGTAIQGAVDVAGKAME
ncbi:hypothetical protein FQR65_LT10533 [Abscondita terminalis]|nr:hypothetical protein FQR65_LT10533 [Abscondita terminalis]